MTDREILFVSLAASGFFTIGVLGLYGPDWWQAWRLRRWRRRHGRLLR